MATRDLSRRVWISLFFPHHLIFRRHDRRHHGRVNEIRDHYVRFLLCRILIHVTSFPDVSRISWPARQDSVSKGDRRETSDSESGIGNTRARSKTLCPWQSRETEVAKDLNETQISRPSERLQAYHNGHQVTPCWYDRWTLDIVEGGGLFRFSALLYQT